MTQYLDKVEIREKLRVERDRQIDMVCSNPFLAHLLFKQLVIHNPSCTPACSFSGALFRRRPVS